jgi:hypothetical protein
MTIKRQRYGRANPEPLRKHIPLVGPGPFTETSQPPDQPDIWTARPDPCENDRGGFQVSRECGFREHDLDYTEKHIDTSTSISELRCLRCGIRMTVTLRSSGWTVQLDVHIYPATGSTTISRDMVGYFFTAYGPVIEELKGAGYQIAENTPTIHGTSVGSGLGLSHTEPPPRRRSHVGVVVSLVAVVAIAGVLFAALAARHKPVTAGPALARSSPASPARTTASPAGPSWVSYQDPSGFSIKLPAGWAVSSRSPGEVDFTGQPPGFVVLVAWTRHPKPDALTDWRQQSAAKAQSDPTYKEIGIHRAAYRGYNAADWEFINVYQGERTHVIDRGFIVQPGHLAYAIELYGPAGAQWSRVYASTWNGLVTSFEPAT